MLRKKNIVPLPKSIQLSTVTKPLATLKMVTKNEVLNLNFKELGFPMIKDPNHRIGQNPRNFMQLIQMYRIQGEDIPADAPESRCNGEIACSDCTVLVKKNDPSMIRLRTSGQDYHSTAHPLAQVPEGYESVLSCQLASLFKPEDMPTVFTVAAGKESISVDSIQTKPSRDLMLDSKLVSERTSGDFSVFTDKRGEEHKIYYESPLAGPELLKHIKELGISEEKNEAGLSELDYIEAGLLVYPTRVTRHITEKIKRSANPKDSYWFKEYYQPPETFGDEITHRILALYRGGDIAKFTDLRLEILADLNPAGSDQGHNVPIVSDPNTGDWYELPGTQHKYSDIVLCFLSQAQYCKAWCAYCFRQGQFAGKSNVRFELDGDAGYAKFLHYLTGNKGISNILITGGDPGSMNGKDWSKTLKPFLGTPKDLAHIKDIRIGTKVPLQDPDWILGSGILPELRKLNSSHDGTRRIHMMLHITHPEEVEDPKSQLVIEALKDAGCIIRAQSPVTVSNNCADQWLGNINLLRSLGVVPYYFFITRDTNNPLLRLPLREINSIHEGIVLGLSAKGVNPAMAPRCSMSTSPGKIEVIDSSVNEETGVITYALRFLRSRDLSWLGPVFYGCENVDLDRHKQAKWYDDLAPCDRHGAPIKEWPWNPRYQVIMNEKETYTLNFEEEVDTSVLPTPCATPEDYACRSIVDMGTENNVAIVEMTPDPHCTSKIFREKLRDFQQTGVTYGRWQLGDAVDYTGMALKNSTMDAVTCGIVPLFYDSAVDADFDAIVRDHKVSLLDCSLFAVRCAATMM